MQKSETRKIERKDKDIPISERACDEKFNVSLSDSSQDYGEVSVKEAYIKGAEDQERIMKWKAQEAFCKVVCPYEQCEVAMCQKIDDFIHNLGGW